MDSWQAIDQKIFSRVGFIRIEQVILQKMRYSAFYNANSRDLIKSAITLSGNITENL